MTANTNIKFRAGEIAGVQIVSLKRHTDARGWLTEVFRQDILPSDLWPAMAYVSMTKPGIARGPHEHVDQTDLFAFIGPGTFLVALWDTRPSSPTYGCKHELIAGADAPTTVAVPPGVVHAYRNIGTEPGFVFNLPNRLYAGPGRSQPVDEIRHEDRADGLFTF